MHFSCGKCDDEKKLHPIAQNSVDLHALCGIIAFRKDQGCMHKNRIQLVCMHFHNTYDFRGQWMHAGKAVFLLLHAEKGKKIPHRPPRALKVEKNAEYDTIILIGMNSLHL